jgi:hypothetical protein
MIESHLAIKTLNFNPAPLLPSNQDFLLRPLMLLYETLAFELLISHNSPFEAECN